MLRFIQRIYRKYVDWPRCQTRKSSQHRCTEDVIINHLYQSMNESVGKKTIYGYMGQILRVDLTEKKVWKEELNLGKKLSVYSIGPAGENLVRFAAVVDDGGHVVAHNGIGAVMGSKNLKAIAAPASGERRKTFNCF